jgi:DNA-binding IclR family transcriptional regulator
MGLTPTRKAAEGLSNGRDATTSVRSVERTFAILSAFSRDRNELTLDEIADVATLPKSTVHRLLQTLIACGVIERGRQYGGYRLSLRLASIGSVALAHRRPQEDIRHFLQELRDQIGETVSLSFLEAGAAVVLDRVVSLHTLPVNIQQGTRLPGHACASGKVLLATLPPAEIDRHFGGTSLQAITTHSITSRAKLKQELRKVREQGYAIDEHEYAVGVSCIAVPLQIPQREHGAYALGLSGSSARLSKADLIENVDTLREYAARIEQYLALFPDAALPAARGEL